MQVDVLVTNGGPHPADKWASLAASKISDLIQVDELSDTDLAAQARRAKPRLAIDLSDTLEPVFVSATQDELARVNAGSVTGRNDPFQPDSYISSAIAAVSAVSATTMFSAHFADPTVVSVVSRIIAELILDAMNIERSWAFDAKGL